MCPRRVLTTILLAGCTVTCSRGRRSELRGQVLAIDLDRRKSTVKHEDIRGFMPGMTMAFHVCDPGSLPGRPPGELVRAKLVVTDASADLTDIEGEAPPEGTFLRGVSSDLVDLLGEVPKVAFVDHTSRSRRLAEFRGRALAVTFIYTRCPLSNFCPLMDRNFAAAQSSELKAELRTLTRARG